MAKGRTLASWQGAWLRVVTERVRLPNGRDVDLDLVRHPGAACVVPFVSADEILLIRQYRYATGGEILELPAGKLEPGEEPETCALRELEEETGLRAASATHLASIWTTPGFTDEIIHLYAARDLEPGVQQLQDDELIELVPTRLEAALEMVWSGELADAKSALALVHAARRFGHLGNLG